MASALGLSPGPGFARTLAGDRPGRLIADQALRGANGKHRALPATDGQGDGTNNHCELQTGTSFDYITTTGILPMRACHSLGPVWCTELPAESTATVTGMSCTVNS